MNTNNAGLFVRVAVILVIFLVGFTAASLAAVKLGAKKQKVEKAIKITAQCFKFTPNVIVLKKGQPTELQLISLDVRHGFNCPGLKLRADVVTTKPAYLQVKAAKKGSYPFFCDVYCGEGHQGMTGKIEVTD
jgi:cytochrome c oxidase subunit 2